MRHATLPDLERAFDLASRIPKRGAAEGVSPHLLRAAREVLSARRAEQTAEPCPTAVLRRVQGWFAARPRGVVRTLRAMLFDSGLDAAPALRGAALAPRTLRFGEGGATVDLQIRSAPRGTRSLHFALQPAVPGAVVVVSALPRGATRRVTLDASGTGVVTLPARTRSIRASWTLLGAEAFRIGPIRLE